MRNLEEITVEVIQRCDSNCIFCSSLSEFNSHSEIPLEKLKEISLFAKSKGANSINISGGEPLLKKDIREYIEYNNLIGLFNVIYTSGNVPKEEYNKIFSSQKQDEKKIKFIFNYPSSNPDTFQKLVHSKKVSPEKIKENILYCIASGYEVEAHIVPNALNLTSIFETCKDLKEIGVKQVSLLRLVLQGRAAENRNILEIQNNNEFERIVIKIKNNLCDDNFNVRFGIPYNIYSEKLSTCIAGYKKLIIKYDGKVFPCEAFKESPDNDKYILGDIYKDKLEEIWENYHSILDLNLLRNIAHSKCESCPAQILYAF